MNFPTPPGHGTKTEPEPTVEEVPADPEPSDEPIYGDDLTQNQLRKAIEEYQFWVAENYPLDLDLDGIPVEVSTKLKRTAGKVAHIRGSDQVKYVRYAWKAYQKWGWEKFTETIRHELIHVHTVQNHSRGGHGRLFKNKVRPLETHRNCESFAEDEAKYLLFCTDCDKKMAQRFRRSKTVKNPDKYRSKCCNAPLRVENN